MLLVPNRTSHDVTGNRDTLYALRAFEEEP